PGDAYEFAREDLGDLPLLLPAAAGIHFDADNGHVRAPGVWRPRRRVRRQGLAGIAGRNLGRASCACQLSGAWRRSGARFCRGKACAARMPAFDGVLAAEAGYQPHSFRTTEAALSTPPMSNVAMNGFSPNGVIRAAR